MYESDRETGIELGKAMIHKAGTLIIGRATGIYLGIHPFPFQLHP